MNNLYKIGSFIFLGIILSYLSIKLKSSFVDKFSENILPLLLALFAINIANSTIITSKLYEISKDKGHSFSSTLKQLKISFYEQIIIISFTVLACIFRESKNLQIEYGVDLIKGVLDSLIFFLFIYFIDIMVDLGKAIFSLIKHDIKNKD